jgi:hypothetical protein
MPFTKDVSQLKPRGQRRFFEKYGDVIKAKETA